MFKNNNLNKQSPTLKLRAIKKICLLMLPVLFAITTGYIVLHPVQGAQQ
jgi:hypothetical protein